MELTHEWQEYDMNYQKAMQDIRTADGKEFSSAGQMQNSSWYCQMISSLVYHIRKSLMSGSMGHG